VLVESSEDAAAAIGRTGAEAAFREIQNQVNDYNETVSALIAFSALVCHDGRARRPESHFALGRRMTTSAENAVSPSTTVTPDFVAQKNRHYGIAAEVKKQISREQEQWEPHRMQLRKYDDDLTGWWTEDEQIEHSDAVILIHQSRSRAFARYLESEKTKGPSGVGDRTAVVEFNRSDERQPFIFFRREWGKVADQDLAALLENGRNVPMAKVLESFPSVRFYDAMPPLEDLMKTVWLDYLLSRYDPSMVDSAQGTAAILVKVSEITAEFQRAYGSQAPGMYTGPRCVEFPKASWIRKALQAFVDLGMAVAADDRESFTVHFRLFKGDVLAKFCQLRAAKPSKKPDENQQLELLAG
jgi:hypothetical protein